MVATQVETSRRVGPQADKLTPLLCGLLAPARIVSLAVRNRDLRYICSLVSRPAPAISRLEEEGRVLEPEGEPLHTPIG